MHGDVDVFLEQGSLERRGEETGSFEPGEVHVGRLVASARQLDHVNRHGSIERAQAFDGIAGLPAGEGAGARTDP